MAETPLAAPPSPDTVSVVAAPSSSSVMPVNRRSLVWLTLGIAAATILADQLTKIWALSALADGRRVDLLGQYLGFRLLRNPGAALGLGYGFTWVLTIVVVAVVVALVRMIRRIGSAGWAWALGLLLGGAIGNLIDRLFRYPDFGHGHVIDFIAYWNWFIGNVADIAIVVAAGLIILMSLRGIGIDGRRESDKARDSTPQPLPEPPVTSINESDPQSLPAADEITRHCGLDPQSLHQP